MINNLQSASHVLMQIKLIIRSVLRNQTMLAQLIRPLHLIQLMMLIQNKKLFMTKVLFPQLNLSQRVTTGQYLRMDRLDAGRPTPCWGFQKILFRRELFQIVFRISSGSLIATLMDLSSCLDAAIQKFIMKISEIYQQSQRGVEYLGRHNRSQN